MTTSILFTQEQLERFAKHDRKVQRIAYGHRYNTSNNHRRGYVYGDLRCCRCLKWLNPNIPEEAVEIRYGKGKHRYHNRCPVYSAYTATLIRSPKFHGTRRKIVRDAKRY